MKLSKDPSELNAFIGDIIYLFRELSDIYYKPQQEKSD